MLHGRLYLRDVKFGEYSFDSLGTRSVRVATSAAAETLPKSSPASGGGELANVSRHISPEGEQRKATTIRYCGIN